MNNSGHPVIALGTSPPGVCVSGWWVICSIKDSTRSELWDPDSSPSPTLSMGQAWAWSQRESRYLRALSLGYLPVHKAISRMSWPFPVSIHSFFSLFILLTKKSYTRAGIISYSSVYSHFLALSLFSEWTHSRTIHWVVCKALGDANGYGTQIPAFQELGHKSLPSRNLHSSAEIVVPQRFIKL